MGQTIKQRQLKVLEACDAAQKKLVKDREWEILIRLDELENKGVEHCPGHSDAPGSCSTCRRIYELQTELAEIKMEVL